ncbi:NAD(P)-binding Rossmann-fold superfamily protein isoform X3 [Tasmannia lanceolata]|uniref:NAD(P)-binding Rossmann-fold superfamily protein isoform X3 n=1 Tax=Tasmannia lanceolata TaxID=3420 RepID=UPI004063AFB1
MAENTEKIDPKLNNESRNCIFLDTSTLRSHISFSSLIQHLQNSLPSVSTLIQSPTRQQFSINPSSSLLLMPSWSSSPSLPYIGVKIVTAFALNSALNLPGINASYLLFDSSTGRNLAVMDGTEITLWRTACVSALAGRFLVREDAQVLVMIGAGSLAKYLISAHLFVRPSLKKVIVWNRTAEKARELVKSMMNEGIEGVCFECGECLEEIIGLGDVISCATSSESPLVKGRELKMGAHLDLVGSFTPSMKECDDEAIGRGRVFVDCEAALVEAGELVGAFDRGVISRGDVVGGLVDLIKGDKCGRRNSDEITVFKSVGSSVVDILTAQLVYEAYLHGLSLSSVLR